MNNNRKALMFLITLVIFTLFMSSYIKYFNYVSLMDYTYNKKLENYSNSKISVVILNFKRPHNLEYSLPKLSKYKYIDEIIVSHGNPNTFVNFDYSPKIRNTKDYELDKLYGAAIRFLKYKDCKNEIILFIDDDVIPDESLVNFTLLNLLSNYKRNTLYGIYGRNCNKDGYSVNKFKHKKPNVVLTPFLMCKKSVINDYMKSKIGFKKYEKWIIDHKGNCEDISLNLFIDEYYKEKPVQIMGTVKNLDITNGYSSNGNHWETRSEFCKIYSP